MKSTIRTLLWESTSSVFQRTVLLLVNVVQISGLFVIIFGEGDWVFVVMGIAGFAAVVNFFLPLQIHATWFVLIKAAAALCGLGLIAMAIRGVM